VAGRDLRLGAHELALIDTGGAETMRHRFASAAETLPYNDFDSY